MEGLGDYIVHSKGTRRCSTSSMPADCSTTRCQMTSWSTARIYRSDSQNSWGLLACVNVLRCLNEGWSGDGPCWTMFWERTPKPLPRRPLISLWLAVQIHTIHLRRTPPTSYQPSGKAQSWYIKQAELGSLSTESQLKKRRDNAKGNLTWNKFRGSSVSTRGNERDLRMLRPLKTQEQPAASWLPCFCRRLVDSYYKQHGGCRAGSIDKKPCCVARMNCGDSNTVAGHAVGWIN